MYVLLDDQENVLIDEIDYVTGEHHHLFVEPERIDAINSYRNKEARISKFFPWYSFEGDYHLVKKSKWLRNLQHRLSLHKNAILNDGCDSHHSRLFSLKLCSFTLGGMS